MLTINNVTFGYTAGVNIIQNFNYTFNKGDIVAVMGESGIGKTTLLRLLCGLEKPNAGSVNSKGLTFSFSPSASDLFPGFSCLENVSVVAKKEVAEFHLKAMGLGDCLNDDISTLSTGMKKRVSIARALANNPDVLIMDEPFSPLDEETKKKVIAHIKEQSPGKIIIFSTHDKEEANTFANKVISL